MAELELIGLADDGEHLVLTSADGTRFTVRIDEPLRAAVRRNRPHLEQLRAADAGTMPPREIQAQVRAGMSTDEVARLGGVSVEQVRRYEGPVLAEREFVATQARGTVVGRDGDSPVLGDLVTDRLAARHVDTSELVWDAWRPVGERWHVSVSYEVGTESRRATWTFDQQTRTLTAVDDEGRWFSETRIVDEPVRRHLEPVRSRVFDAVPYDHETDPRGPATGAGSEGEEAPAAPADPTRALLDDLSARRGVRQEIDVEEEELDDPSDDEAARSAHTETSDTPADDDAPLPGARLYSLLDRSRTSPAGTAPASPGSAAGADASDDAAPGLSVVAPGTAGTSDDGTLDIPVEESTPPPLERSKPRGGKGRPKVPSWDEIVFGARSDD
ncbi:septation protein SepH [Sanguibacter sp. A247]|uniref:septation protein SepH n=1 Tax=unclassified Sanguibacter TaxID=2645534 RepID=UPI003FD6F32C